MSIRWWLSIVGVLGLVACASGRPARTVAPRATLPPIIVQPSPTPVPIAKGWASVAPGIERYALQFSLPVRNLTDHLTVFRIDQRQVTWRVLYTPGQPRYVSDWDRSAGLVINGGYFDENNRAVGLLVREGAVFGQSYTGFGGMFQVINGVASIRSLAAHPYASHEVFEHALQAFPLLIYPDGSAYAKEDGQVARRTALAQDAAGNLYAILATRSLITLTEFAAILRASDLGLTLALNLDGGGSTGYYAGTTDQANSYTPVPAVIAVYPRP